MDARSQTARRVVRRCGWVLGAVLVTGSAFAQGGDDAGGSALDRLIFTLAVLVVISQGTERLMLLLRKLLGTAGVKWAQSPTEEEAKDPQKSGERAMLLSAYSVLVGMVVAFVSRVDTLAMFRTGQVEIASDSLLAWTTQVWMGVILTGFIASTGSAFLNDLLAVLQATKDLKRVDRAAVQAEVDRKRALPAGSTQGS